MYKMYKRGLFFASFFHFCISSRGRSGRSHSTTGTDAGTRTLVPHTVPLQQNPAVFSVRGESRHSVRLVVGPLPEGARGHWPSFGHKTPVSIIPIIQSQGDDSSQSGGLHWGSCRCTSVLPLNTSKRAASWAACPEMDCEIWIWL